MSSSASRLPSRLGRHARHRALVPRAWALRFDPYRFVPTAQGPTIDQSHAEAFLQVQHMMVGSHVSPLFRLPARPVADPTIATDGWSIQDVLRPPHRSPSPQELREAYPIGPATVPERRHAWRSVSPWLVPADTPSPPVKTPQDGRSRATSRELGEAYPIGPATVQRPRTGRELWRKVSDPSPSKLRRLMEGAAMEGADPKFYSEESVRFRFSLMQDPAVTAALDKLWTAANFDDRDAIIDQKEYLTMHCSQ